MTAIDRLLSDAAQDADVLAVLLAGSRGAGIHDERSDYDVYVLVREPRPRLKAPPLDVAYVTIEATETIDWWTPGFVYARVLLDKTGEVAELQQRLSRAAAGDPLEHYDAYLNSFIRSTRAWERDEELGARMHAAESLAWLAKTLFALEGRVAPYHDRLFLHLDAEWLPAFREVARSADVAAQRALEARVAALLGERGAAVAGGWDPAQLDRARGSA
jgi:hypothetical protein